jgi:hypothetical protein
MPLLVELGCGGGVGAAEATAETPARLATTSVSSPVRQRLEAAPARRANRTLCTPVRNLAETTYGPTQH